jgi:hypothetical protein
LDWSKLATARTILLTVLGFLAIAAGVAMFNLAAGLIAFGILCALLAYLTDVSGQATGRTR